MYKYFTHFFFIITLFLNNSFAETINNVEVVGNKRISKETIVVLSGINQNDDIQDYNLNESLKKLYETDFFSDIKFSINDSTLNINVIENPIIEKINIIGIKKKSLEELIYNSISLKELSIWCEGRFGVNQVGSSQEERPMDAPWIVMDTSCAYDYWDWKPQTNLERIFNEIAEHAEKKPNWLELVS